MKYFLSNVSKTKINFSRVKANKMNSIEIQRNKFIKDIEKTVQIMNKNKLPSCKKQVVPPLYDYIPYCKDRKSRPTKRLAQEGLKEFYQKCNEVGVYTESKIIYQMKSIIEQGRQVMTKEDCYSQKCQQMNDANCQTSFRSREDAKKSLANKKKVKEDTIREEAKKEKERQKLEDEEDGEEENKEDNNVCLLNEGLLNENREIPDSWDDEF